MIVDIFKNKQNIKMLIHTLYIFSFFYKKTKKYISLYIQKLDIC